MGIVAIIDADLILHKAAWANTDVIEWSPTCQSRFEDLQSAKQTVDDTLREMDVGLNAEYYLLAFSHTKNFRKSLNPDYKSNRDISKRPKILDPLKEHMMLQFPSVCISGLEADDVLGIYGTSRGFVMCSYDKDLKTVPGLHYDWRKPDIGITEVSHREAEMFFFEQCLTGDSVDGYYGIKGIGPKKAKKILSTSDPVEAKWRVAQAYSCKGLSYDYMLMQMRMARILRDREWDQKNEVPILYDPNL